MSEYLKAVIIDNGSGMCKAGFGGDEAPCSVFHSIVGVKKNILGIVGTPGQNIYVGDEAYTKTRTHNIKYPIDRGIVTDWDYIEEIFKHAFYDQLRIDPSDQPLILTEAPMSTNASHEKLTQMMFESFNVPLFYIGNQSVLSLYSSGRTTGVVIDIGDGVSQIVPIYEGHSLVPAIKNLNLAGRDLTSWLQKILQERGYTINEDPQNEIVRDIKEKHAYVALDYDAEQQKAKESSENDVLYTLPDGQIIKITDERFRCPELLFKPQMNGFELEGIDQTLFDSIMKCDIDIRRDLFKNIVLSGGSTMLEGLPERLEKEITRYVAPTMKVKVTSPQQRKYAAWIGGSILASFDTFPQMAITHDEYNEVGPEIVHRILF